jgi:predicted lipoprotein with Yx(FWY)xxD motif
MSIARSRSRWRTLSMLGLAVLALGVVSLSFSPGPARAQATATVLIAQNATLGPFLTDSQGMTLYLRKSDPPGGSSCTGGCATTWPPLLSSGSLVLPNGAMGVLGTFTRDDGSQQVTYNGVTLYRYQQDAAPGDTNGQGVGSNWYVVAP